jgi:putative endonuclease
LTASWIGSLAALNTVFIITFLYLYFGMRTVYNVYIVTNSKRTTLYTGISNNLAQRLVEHYLNRGKPQTFPGRYYCYNLLHFESFDYVEDAIAREKEIKSWRRSKKIALINSTNLNWKFLNHDILDWPPGSSLLGNRMIHIVILFLTEFSN